MNDDEAFVQAIAANPNDDTLRLVYADWLEERGDVRGEYLRLDCLLDASPTPEKQERYTARLAVIAGELDAKWLQKVGRKIDIFLRSYERGKKLNVIKVLLVITGLGLRYVGDLVNFPSDHPSVRVTQATSKREARRIKHLLKEHGAVISVIPEVD